MLWTLVYVIMVQGGATSVGTPDVVTWPTGLKFSSQQECIRVANEAAPGLMRGADVSSTEGNIPGKPPNWVSASPMCFPSEQ